MAGARIVELTIPGTLAFRDLAIRVVMESCKLVGRDTSGADMLATDNGKVEPSSISYEDGYELRNSFTSEFISAFSEIYNNIPIHAYQRAERGNISIRVTIGADSLTVDITDTGQSFDIQSVPLPDSLPTSGMGIHIARSMLDDLRYEPGPPNHWHLTKYLSPPQAPESPSLETTPPAE
ncbi:ATP-binding protein [Haliangium sp.]|uniref:ATP-binding protein n=1 Tax=Haliangium sp. TaxID=2663208 RepID=UPI003D11C956